MDALQTALQPLLQPITHNLPQPLTDLGTSLLGAHCYTSLVLDIALTDTPCLKLAVSKGLGIGIVSAASIVKLPQILNLVRARSAAGVSLAAYLLETTSYLISLAYNVRNAFPFSTYGETALILAQNVVITVLVLAYSGRAGAAAVLVALLAVGAAALASEAVVDGAMLGVLQAGAGTLGVVSKVPQILAIFREGGTGQLSAFTVSALFSVLLLGPLRDVLHCACSPPHPPMLFWPRFYLPRFSPAALLDLGRTRHSSHVTFPLWAGPRGSPLLQGVPTATCFFLSSWKHVPRTTQLPIPDVAKRAMHTPPKLTRPHLAGLQLSRRLLRPHLHDLPGGGRQADPVRLRRGLCAELRARGADGVLLERAVCEDPRQAQGEGLVDAGRRQEVVVVVVEPRWEDDGSVTVCHA